jgi:hypothetical protein
MSDSTRAQFEQAQGLNTPPDVVLERDQLLAERYEAIEALTHHKALQARVTALETALRTLLTTYDALSANDPRGHAGRFTDALRDARALLAFPERLA